MQRAHIAHLVTKLSGIQLYTGCSLHAVKLLRKGTPQNSITNNVIHRYVYIDVQYYMYICMRVIYHLYACFQYEKHSIQYSIQQIVYLYFHKNCEFSENYTNCEKYVFPKSGKFSGNPGKSRKIPENPRKIPRENSGFFLIFRL